MKRIRDLFFVLALLVSGNSLAALISIDASAEMTSGTSVATSLFPIGTNLVADFSFDVGPGNRATASITDVSGSFSWVDSVFGPQSYDATSASVSGFSTTGFFEVRFLGDRQTVGDITANTFRITFVNGIDTFRPPGNSVELYDLFLVSTIGSIDVVVQQPGEPLGSADFETNVSSSISAVPVPAAFWLFGTALIGLVGIGKRSKLT